MAAKASSTSAAIMEIIGHVKETPIACSNPYDAPFSVVFPGKITTEMRMSQKRNETTKA